MSWSPSRASLPQSALDRGVPYRESKPHFGGSAKPLPQGVAGTSGSVRYFFSHVGVITASPPDASADLEEAAIEAGAQEVRRTEEGAEFTCEKTDLVSVTKHLQDAGWQIHSSEFEWVAKDPVEVSGEARKEIEAFLGEIDDNDDVHRIYTALK